VERRSEESAAHFLALFTEDDKPVTPNEWPSGPLVFGSELDGDRLGGAKGRLKVSNSSPSSSS
jgi:hypothetical protein